MRKMIQAFAILTLSSCTFERPEERRTVEYYRAHPQEREARILECKNDPGGLAHTPNCVNARQAARLEGPRSFRDLPPMGLLPPDDKARADGASVDTQ